MPLAGRKRQKLPEIPASELSEQQRAIYELARKNLSNKEIAGKLGIEARNVALQLSRIRKKAEDLGYTYKIEPGAEHAQNTGLSPAQELKDKIKNDPGFISLMYQRYGTGQEQTKENRFQLAAAGGAQRELFKERAKHLKAIIYGGQNSEEKILLRLSGQQRKQLRRFFSQNKITPIQTFWDDESAVYKVTFQEFKEIQRQLEFKETGEGKG